MIREEKYKHALYALHEIFVRGRFMAYAEESYKDIARLLDYAEIMPNYMVSENDETEKFISCLEGIVESFPKFRYILDNFNAEESYYETYKI
jgi:hypothetical protein